MNPYQPAIEALLEEAQQAESAASSYEDQSLHVDAARERMLAASCRAAITRLGGEPNAGRLYVWDDIESYSDSIDHDKGERNFFLTMKGGAFHKITVANHEDEQVVQAAVLAKLNQAQS